MGYNRGAANPGIKVLSRPIANKSWKVVAETIGQMQQDHKLPGIRERRRLEAKLILDGIPG